MINTMLGLIISALLLVIIGQLSDIRKHLQTLASLPPTTDDAGFSMEAYLTELARKEGEHGLAAKPVSPHEQAVYAMAKRGEQPTAIARALGLGKEEVRLILKKRAEG